MIARYFLLLLFIYTPCFALDRIHLQLKWYHQFQFAGYYAAIEKGYYSDVGLDVQLVETPNGDEALENVLSRKYQFGTGNSGILLNRQAGKPVVVIAVIFQHSPDVLITSKINSVQSIHDILAKPVMLSRQSFEILAYLKKEGIATNDFIKLEHSFNFDDLLKGKVYGMNGYSTDQPFYLENVHFAYQVFSPRSAGIDFYGDNLFTSEKEIQEYPERVKAFREASLLGWQYAMSNQEEIVDLILEKYSKRMTRNHLLYEAKQMVSLVQPVLVELGYMNPGRWRHIAEVYADLGMLSEDVNLEEFIYDPNPRPNLKLFYQTLGGLLFIGLVVWIIQRRRLIIRYSENLKKEVELRTNELNKSNAELSLTNSNLAHALEEINSTHSQLIQSEKLASLGILTAGIAHEINNPVNYINSSITALNGLATELIDVLKVYETITPENITQKLEEIKGLKEQINLSETIEGVTVLSNNIKAGAKKTADIVKSLRTFSRMDNDEQTLSDINENLDSTLILLHNQYKDRIEIIKNYGKLPLLKCFAGKLNQVFMNLLANAIQAINESGTITIRTEYLQSGLSNFNKECVIISIKDTGSGISLDIKNKVFEPFFTTKEIGKGTGLGLAISYGIIEQHKGKIEFNSEVGIGTEFTIYLPCK
ncbi:MAG: ABC transporter substrate-binding protein [Leptospiraceae bacterium]|nr:ABC transporter substrate-binding protein [Leptospiraceae bacterium]